MRRPTREDSVVQAHAITLARRAPCWGNKHPGKAREPAGYLDRYKRDMIDACQIDGEHLEQLEALAKALETIDYHWPPYRRTY
jgi:hypothetical protein